MNSKKLMFIGLTTILGISVLAIFTAVAGAVPCGCGDICVNETGWWRDGGVFNASNTPIQHAIDNASAGNTICVKDGTYNENVDVTKSHLTIRSENGSDVTTVTAADITDHVFNVTKDYVNISGFNVTGATVYGYAGIFLNNTEHCNISNNSATNNRHGIYLWFSSNNTLTNNTADSNIWYGIHLHYSSNNTLINNIASSHITEYCIYLHSSSNNTLINNTMSGNLHNLRVSGSTLSHYIQNIDTSNTIDGKPIYYWIDSHDKQIPNDAGYVGVVKSTNITVRNLTLKNNGQGVLFAYTSNSMIENVTASNNHDGIFLWNSSNNTLTDNTASNNHDYGIWLNYSRNNNITGNTASNNHWGGRHLPGVFEQ